MILRLRILYYFHICHKTCICSGSIFCGYSMSWFFMTQFPSGYSYYSGCTWENKRWFSSSSKWTTCCQPTPLFSPGNLHAAIRFFICIILFFYINIILKWLYVTYIVSGILIHPVLEITRNFCNSVTWESRPLS